jgi:hypothetical protein
MALFEYKYTDLKDRAVKVTEAESKGQVMLHDNFDATWKPGAEPFGVMLFTDTPPAAPVTPASRDLATEIDQMKVEIQGIKTSIAK